MNTGGAAPPPDSTRVPRPRAARAELAGQGQPSSRVPLPGGGPRTSAAPVTTVSSPGPRTFTIALPAGLKLLSLNGREHWSERARRTESLKKAAWAMTLQAKIPRLDRVSVVVEYQPPDHRRRDADNPAPSAKACIDGIVAAGVLTDDACPRYVTGIQSTIGEPYPKGRLVIHLTEVLPLEPETVSQAAGGAR
jgi:crossover junction endodeoxyribonuclease RusA